MRRFLFGFLTGIVVVGVTAAWLFTTVLEARTEHARHVGQLHGIGATVATLRQEFGEGSVSSTSQRLFSHKTSDVVTVVIDGVKTIRVVP